MKVYCKDCKHRTASTIILDDSVNCRCKKRAETYENFYEKHTRLPFCSLINENNDCQDFEPSFLARIKAAISEWMVGK